MNTIVGSNPAGLILIRYMVYGILYYSTINNNNADSNGGLATVFGTGIGGLSPPTPEAYARVVGIGIEGIALYSLVASRSCHKQRFTCWVRIPLYSFQVLFLIVTFEGEHRFFSLKIPTL